MTSARLLEQWQFLLGTGLGGSSRQEVAVHFSNCAPSVDLKTADRRTKGFYRSSGNAWARALG